MRTGLSAVSKLRLLVVGLSAVAAIVVGVARVRIVKEINPVQTRTRTVLVSVPRQVARDGMMTDDQCAALARGRTSASIVDQYGLPKGGDPRSEDVGWYHYPIRGGQGRDCFLEFGSGSSGLDNVSLDLPLKTHEGR